MEHRLDDNGRDVFTPEQGEILLARAVDQLYLLETSVIVGEITIGSDGRAIGSNGESIKPDSFELVLAKAVDQTGRVMLKGALKVPEAALKYMGPREPSTT